VKVDDCVNLIVFSINKMNLYPRLSLVGFSTVLEWLTYLY